jgi:hypothetical protein
MGITIRRSHEKVGLTLYILMVLQVFSAFFRPRGSTKPSTSSETDIETFQDDQAELENTSSKKSVARFGWEISHTITALAMIALVMYTLLSGIEAYERIYGEKKQMKTLYWVWFGIVSACTVIVSFRSIFVKKE